MRNETDLVLQQEITPDQAMTNFDDLISLLRSFAFLKEPNFVELFMKLDSGLIRYSEYIKDSYAMKFFDNISWEYLFNNALNLWFAFKGTSLNSSAVAIIATIANFCISAILEIQQERELKESRFKSIISFLQALQITDFRDYCTPRNAPEQLAQRLLPLAKGSKEKVSIIATIVFPEKLEYRESFIKKHL